MKNNDPTPHNVIYTTQVRWGVFLQMIREKSGNSFELKFTIKSRQSSEKQTNSNIVTGGKVKQKKRSSLHLPMSHCIPVSGGNSAKTQSDICYASQSSPRRAGSVRGQGGCVLDGDVRMMNQLSCSQTERAGHRYCCWAGLEDPSRTATHLGLSALGEAGTQIRNSGVKNRPVRY